MKILNAALSFLLELAMLMAFGYFGFQTGGSPWLKWLVGIGLPVLVIVFWGLWMAPKASYRLPWPILPVISLILFLTAAALLYAAGGKTWATVMAVASVINAALVFLRHQY